MISTNLRSSFACAMILAAAVTCSVRAQPSGFPGDGIPDLYFYPYLIDSLTFQTSFGPVTRPGGTLLLDTDGRDVVAVLVGGPNVSVAPACDLCDGQELPLSPSTGDTFTVGYAGGSTQWIRTSPLVGRGFVGVIGTGYVDQFGVPRHEWPADVPPF